MSDIITNKSLLKAMENNQPVDFDAFFGISNSTNVKKRNNDKKSDFANYKKNKDAMEQEFFDNLNTRYNEAREYAPAPVAAYNHNLEGSATEYIRENTPVISAVGTSAQPQNATSKKQAESRTVNPNVNTNSLKSFEENTPNISSGANFKSQKMDNFGTWLGKQAMAGLGQFNKGVAATLDFILPTEVLGKYDFISKLNESYSSLYNSQYDKAHNSSRGKGKGWTTAGDIVAATVAAAPNAILAYMTAGTSIGASGANSIANTAPTASTTVSALKQSVNTMLKNPSYWTSVMQTLGTDYEEAKARGANDVVASATAIITTALNAGIEVGGGVEKLPSKLKNGGKNAVFEWAKSAFEEGGEEVLQSITTNTMAKLMYDHNAPIVSTTDDTAVFNPKKLGTDFAMGVAVGGILGGGQTAVAKGIETAQYTKAGKYFNKPASVNMIIEAGLSNPINSNAYMLADKAKNKLTKTGKISNYEVGKLFYSNIDQIDNLFGSNKQQDKDYDYTPNAHNDDFSNFDNGENINTAEQVQTDNMQSQAVNTQNTYTGKSNNIKFKLNTENDVGDTVNIGGLTLYKNGDVFESYDKDAVDFGDLLGLSGNGMYGRSVKIPLDVVQTSYVERTDSGYDLYGSIAEFAKDNNNAAVINGKYGRTVRLYTDGTTFQTNDNQVDKAVSADKTNYNSNTGKGTRNILLKQVGDFYEAYGKNATELADRLDLHITKKNGQDMVGFPVSALQGYAYKLNMDMQQYGDDEWSGIKLVPRKSAAAVNDSVSNNNNISVNEDTSTQYDESVSDGVRDGKIISLKHTRNIYSLFKGADKIFVIKNLIGTSHFLVPSTDNSLAIAKETANVSDDNVIHDDKLISTIDAQLKNNHSVIVQGDPKVDTIKINGKKETFYAFKIGDKIYGCKSKFIDAFNNGNNTIKVNNNNFWIVEDENGDFAGLFLGIRYNANNMTEERFNSLKYVSEIKEEEHIKRNESANKPFSRNEISMFVKDSKSIGTLEIDGKKYIGDGSAFVKTDDEGINLMLNEYNTYNNYSRSYNPEFKKIKSGIAEKCVYATEIASNPEWINKIKTDGSSDESYVYDIGNYAVAFNKKYVNMIKKRSNVLKIRSTGRFSNTVIVGYDSSGSITGFALPLECSGSITAKDGNKISFVNDEALGNLVENAKRETNQTNGAVSENDTNINNNVMQIENGKKITVDISDEERTEILKNKSINVAVVDDERTRKFENVDIDKLQSSLLRYAKPIIEKVASDFDILNKTYFNPDIELEFEYSKNSLKESMNKQQFRYGDFVKMLSVFPDVISNAVGVETHNDKYKGTTRENTSLKQMYVLASAVMDETGIIPVKLEVKEFHDRKNKLYLTVALTKKESGDLHASLGQNQLHTATPTLTISISDLVGIVNPKDGNFLKYFPDNMLDAEQIEGKRKAIEHDAKKIDKLAAGDRSVSALNNDNSANNANNRKNLYDVYRRMKDRCYNSSAKDYKYYGDKGVKVNKNWLDSFEAFYRWALDNGYEDGLTIDRIDPYGDYEPSNCRWVTMSEQNRNKRSNNVENSDRVLNNRSERDIIEEKTDKDGVKNVESKSEILGRESEPYGGGLRSGADGADVEERTEALDRTSRQNGGERLQKSTVNESDGRDGRDAGKRVYGADDAENDVSEARRTQSGAGGRGELLGGRDRDVSGIHEQSERVENNASETESVEDEELDVMDTEVKKVTSKKQYNKDNLVIVNSMADELDNTPPSAKDNIEAMELLLKLENEGRQATNAEKTILAKYKGWGGIDIRNMQYDLRRRFDKLFDYEQRKAMQSSQNNAYFTPTKVIDAIYKGIKRMGFKGGNVLEPSMGVGNFFGRMPVTLSSKSALTGVELESYTARIAQYLYPGATVINMPFQDVAIRNGSYDLVVGNVPFGNNKISYNKKKYSLHNYFIISALDKCNDGGIVAVITSAGTLDSYGIDARNAIMDRADVIACYKLPEKVFSRNASTNVQSDLLILRKRANGAKPRGDSILNVKETGDGLRLNEYFIKHPENILGTLAKGKNAWGEITTVKDDGHFYEKLNEAMEKLPKGLISGKSELKTPETIIALSSKPMFFEKNGKVYADDGAGTATEVSKNHANTVRDYIAVRDAYKELLNAYENGKTIIKADGTATITEMSEEDIKPLRDALSQSYDNFYAKHGPITGDGKKKIGKTRSKNNTFLEADADYYLVGGLERYDAKNSTFEKSALFEKDTLRKKKVTKVDSASDALAVSLNENGRIDFDRMNELTGKSEQQLIKELSGEIVLTPEGEYVLTDIYLSGNIYGKLDKVKGKKGFEKQQKMLESVIPTPKDASSIIVKLGANYIEPKYVEQFAREVFNIRLTIRKDVTGKWVIEGVRQSRYGDIVNVKYGCDAFNAVQLLEKILNDSEITATKRISLGGKTVNEFDSKMTDVANQKANDIRDAFSSWVFKDIDRRNDILNKYNRMYNNYRPVDYTKISEKLSFDSMDKSLKEKLYPHQKKGIARFLFGGNTLFAHGVGTGKTFEMIASVMEAKRMGIINKAAMVVPNNKVVDFKNDIAQAYPNAKVLVIDTANKKRQSMLGLINSNDWDIILIARTTFTKIPVSRQMFLNYITQQLYDLNEQIAEAESDSSISKRQLNSLTKQRDDLEQKIKDLNSETKRDENSVEFEKLGIDCICVDEAHNYKSIMTPTKLNIKGLVNKNSAQMANDMLMKLDYLRSIDGRIIFGTGTPITNTVSEIYNMMRMVRPDILEDAGIHSLDEWVNTFANIETTTEIGIDNSIKQKSTQVIRSFVNVSEMTGMFRQFADIVFTEDVVKNLPKANLINIELKGTPEHKKLQSHVSEVLKSTPKKELLKVHGKLMAMLDVAAADLRMLSGADSDNNILKDYSTDELEYSGSKINVMCDTVYKEYTQSNEIKGTQIIFCDKGSGSGKVFSFNLHKDIMNKLIERGIPKDQIAIIKNQNDAQLEELYEKVNNGEVRVLIGTSQKMAEGLNVQKRVVAIHHPTVTYKPSDWEQGNARGVRSGNINDEVRIYRYLQENTFDSHKWQAQDRKGEMIKKALRGDMVDEMEDIGADEDGGESIDAATAMAITSGNPLVKEKIDIDKEVTRLKSLQRNYLNEVYHYQDVIAKNPSLIEQLISRADNMKQDIGLRNKYSDNAYIEINGKRFEKQSDANKALDAAVKSAPKNGKLTKLGEYNGFDIMFKGDTGGMNYNLVLKGANEYNIDYSMIGNNTAKFARTLNRLDADLNKLNATIDVLKSDLEFAKHEINKPFEKEKELNDAIAKQKDITYRYEHYSNDKQNDVTSDKDSRSDSDAVDYDSENTGIRSHKVRKGSDSSNDANNAQSDNASGKESKKSKGVVTLADIINTVRKKFNIPIATGKVTDTEASAIYKEKPETIRTRTANDLRSISHELGHHLDKRYNLTKLNGVSELREEISEDFLNQYKESERDAEAVAEFINAYISDIENAKNMSSQFYNDFISTLSRKDLKSLDEVADMANKYLSYSISDKYSAAIVSSKAKMNTSFSEMKDKFITAVFDTNNPIKIATDYVQKVTGNSLMGKHNAYVLATNSLNADVIANYLLKEGFRDLNGNILKKKSFIECIAGVKAKELKILDKYLVLKHSLEWIAPINPNMSAKRVFADEELENIDTIKAEIAKIEKQFPNIKQAAENLYDYQSNVLKHFVVKSGCMSQELFNELQIKYPCYVPFYRAIGKDTNHAKGTFANQKVPIKRAKGSGELIISPLESIIKNTEKMVRTSLRNQTMRLLANYSDHVDGFGQFMERIPPDMERTIIDISNQKDSFNKALEGKLSSMNDFSAVSDLLDEVFGDAVAGYTPFANSNKHIVSVMEKGKNKYYQVHDTLLYDCIAEMTPKQIDLLTKLSMNVLNPMKLLITQYNPIFATKNIIRDANTAYRASQVNNPVTYALNYMTSFIDLIRNTDEVKQYRALGGGHSSELSANINSISRTLNQVAKKDMGIARRLASSIFQNPLTAIQELTGIVADINDFAESVPRFTEFKSTLKKGGDLQEAIYNANDVTTNFRMRGKSSTIKAINNTVMFNNAALQGLYKLYRLITEPDPVKRAKTLLKFVIAALLAGILNDVWNSIKDPEGYKNLSSYKKNNFYNFSIGDNKFISLPKPREYAVLDSVTERMIDYYKEKDEDAFYGFGEYLALQMLPPSIPSTLSPTDALHEVMGSTAFGGIADVGFNEDFKGSPIETDYEKTLPSNERYNQRTSAIAYGLGQTKYARSRDISPKKIDHIINSYFGIFGDLNEALLPHDKTMRDKSLGLKNKFISDSTYSTDLLNKLYDNADKAKIQYEFDKSAKNAIEYEKNIVITDFVSNMVKAERELPEENRRDARKYLLKVLNHWDSENSETQNNIIKRYGDDEMGESCIIREIPKSVMTWQKDKERYKYTMTPVEYYQYVNKYLESVDSERKKSYNKKDTEKFKESLEYVSKNAKNGMKSIDDKLKKKGKKVQD